MTPPRMYIEGQNETKVCKESIQWYREIDDDQHRDTEREGNDVNSI